MKKKAVSIVITALALALTACGAKGEDKKTDKEEKETITKDSEPEEILEEANRQYGKHTVRGTDCTYTYLYSDGSVQEETGATVFDMEKGVQHMVYQQGDKILSQIFNVKDGDSYYTYTYDEEDGYWVRYKQTADDNGRTSYQYQEEGELFAYNLSYGYDKASYSREGEEKVNGVDTIKIKVTAEEAVSKEEGSDEVTKEDVLEDYGLTEEAVGYIDGLAEELDQYVKAMNQASYGSKTFFEDTIWLDAKDFTPVKCESVTTFSNMETVDDTGVDLMADFENHYWKAIMVQEDLDNGMSLSEALDDVKNNESAMEEEEELTQDEPEEETDTEEDEPEQVSITSVETYVYGDECMKAGEVPAEYKEVTEEDYLYGEY